MISREDLEHYRSAGKILSEVRRLAYSMVSEGIRVLDLCERIESEIVRLGGRPAFPCNVGINEVAAHYTSPWDDLTTIPNESVVKVDFGVQVDGFITDTAATICLSPEYEAMRMAAEEGVKVAIARIGPGVKLSEVGAAIEKSIERYGYRPIRNLSGHKIERFIVHAGKSVPNVSGGNLGRFQVGEVFAIEPFVTSREAAGMVEDIDRAYIHRFVKEKGVSSDSARSLLRFIRDNYRTLPFAHRWLVREFTEERLKPPFQEAKDARCIASYPVLVEASGNVVTQAEETVIVTENGCEVLTV